MGEAAVQAARSCGYRGAGTVEFIVPGSDPSSYYFMEMNTRLQVEHPVTELITGLDLVEWQLRVAAGEPLPYEQEDITLTGHAVEARICAEDPSRGFLPSGGTVLALHEPQGDGVRTDSGLSEGTEVGSLYDPMLSKVIAYGPDRATALRRLRAALAETVTLGVQTNAGFLRRLLAHPAVVAGELDTGLVEREAGRPGRRRTCRRRCTRRRRPCAWTRCGRARRAAGRTRSRCRAAGGWAATAEARSPPDLRRAGTRDPVAHAPRGEGAHTVTARPGRGHPRRRHATPSTAPPATWLGRDGDAWHVRDHDPVAASLTGAAHAGADSLTAPMPGTVTVVKVAVGRRGGRRAEPAGRRGDEDGARHLRPARRHGHRTGRHAGHDGRHGPGAGRHHPARAEAGPDMTHRRRSLASPWPCPAAGSARPGPDPRGRRARRPAEREGDRARPRSRRSSSAASPTRA